MRRRSSAGGEPAKVQRRKTVARKSRVTSKAADPKSSSAAREETTVARLTRELNEALEQQTATSEVLQVISRSVFDLEAVLNTLVESAARLCEADKGAILRPIGKSASYRVAASYGHTPEFIEHTKTLTLAPGRSSATGQLLLEGKSIQIPDVLADPEFIFLETARLGNFRTILGVPLLREGIPVGIFNLHRAEVRPFTEKQIKLVETFADQAVIAIENVRLFEAEQQRTRELTESLEQQTATSEVLQVISSSPGELQPVFEGMLEKAVRICDAKFGNIYRWDGSAMRLVSAHNTPPAFAEARRRSALLGGPKTAMRRMVATNTTVHVIDAAADEAYLERDASYVEAVELAGVRTLLVVPLLKDNGLMGAFTVYRQEVRPFAEKQIALVQNFAAQAVIAIENTRLLNELRQRTTDLTERTADLTEALEQQTATSEVLQVISSSPGDLQPVFTAMVEHAVRICNAKWGNIHLWDGETLHLAASHNVPPAFAAFRRSNPHYPPHPKALFGRLAATQTVTQIADSATVEAYTERLDPVHVAAVELGGARTALGVPMLKENRVIGAFALIRQEVRPFTDKQIELVQNFAAQAVIAIENTRLLNELRESLQQQTATADVLKVVSSSPGDLQPVFQAMLENAVGICNAKFGNIFRWDGEALHLAATHNTSPAYAEARRRSPLRPGPNQPIGRMVATKGVVHVADLAADPGYIERRFPATVDAVELGGVRTVLAVPMLKENELIGAFTLSRQEVRPFTDKQIALVTNFAAQAVIAIENTRLLSELRESLQQQTATADVLKVISRSTFDLQTVLQTLVESAARLCDADKTIITRQKNGVFYRAEAYGFSRDFIDYVRNIPIQPERGSAFGRALLEGRAAHIPDVKADPEYTLVEGQRLGDYRTALAVPMLREGVPTGVLSLSRSEVRPFTEKQIELASTFADQAAIAIENVRLFESVEARTRELAKSLEDLRTTQDRLVQTQKLASLGQLTAGIAHEIKNPLNFVNNFSGVSAELIDELREALGRMTGDDKTRREIAELTDTLRDNLDKIVQHGKRADAIVKNMLLHSREGSGEHRLVDANALVEESLNLAYHGARAEKQGFKINMERSFDPAAGEIDVYPQEITRALLNLISNGFYAATKHKEQDNSDGYEPSLMAATKNLGDKVEIRIRDNGIGIPPEVKEKMFNPFFTTKPAGEGTGLGLSITHDIIVKQHSGSIEVDTQPGEFTEIRIILPRTATFIAESGGRA